MYSWLSLAFFTTLLPYEVSSIRGISPLQECELKALRLGTELGDVFNAISMENITIEERIFQDYIVKNLGFADNFIHSGINGTHKTISHQDVHILQEEGGWINKKGIQRTWYSTLENKWIYMIGDSTTRQNWASYSAPFQNNNFQAAAKEWTRHYCDKTQQRENRKIHHEEEGETHTDGWKGPCYLNEVTCHVPGYGKTGALSFDWKHFPWEDYDEYFWGSRGPWYHGFSLKGEPTTRRPDLITIQLGLHSCDHAHNDWGFLVINQTMITKHQEDIHTLIHAIRQAVDASSKEHEHRTTVIFLTSGATGASSLLSLQSNACISAFNRIVMETAHRYHFAVLDRGEIERRVVYQSAHSVRPILTLDTHLGQPVPEIIATSLLHLYHCIEEHHVSQSRR